MATLAGRAIDAVTGGVAAAAGCAGATARAQLYTLDSVVDRGFEDIEEEARRVG